MDLHTTPVSDVFFGTTMFHNNAISPSESNFHPRAPPAASCHLDPSPTLPSWCCGARKTWCLPVDVRAGFSKEKTKEEAADTCHASQTNARSRKGGCQVSHTVNPWLIANLINAARSNDSRVPVFSVDVIVSTDIVMSTCTCAIRSITIFEPVESPRLKNLFVCEICWRGHDLSQSPHQPCIGHPGSCS